MRDHSPVLTGISCDSKSCREEKIQLYFRLKPSENGVGNRLVLEIPSRRKSCEIWKSSALSIELAKTKLRSKIYPARRMMQDRWWHFYYYFEITKAAI